MTTMYFRESYNDNEKKYKYMCITSNQPDTKSDHNPNSNPTTTQHAIVNIQLNYSHMSYVSRKTLTRKFYCTALLLSAVIVTLPVFSTFSAPPWSRSYQHSRGPAIVRVESRRRRRSRSSTCRLERSQSQIRHHTRACIRRRCHDDRKTGAR